jgi:hypothetical protein
MASCPRSTIIEPSTKEQQMTTIDRIATHRRLVETALTVHRAGMWLVTKARQQQATLGTYRAACNLRKQGASLELALAILRRRT